MFCKNRYITELGYDSEYGLFDGCVYLNNVDGMFLSATYLHKGIPNNIFGTTNLPNIIRLYRMFELTNVLYDIPNEIDGGKKWVDVNTIKPLINLTSIERMFAHNRMGNANTGHGPYSDIVSDTVLDASNTPMWIINPDTFSGTRLQNIRSAFEDNAVIRTIPLRFLSFLYGERAFCNAAITTIDSNFISDAYVSEVNNASMMFYVIPTLSKSITNLGSLVTKLQEQSSANIQNIAGNLLNTDVSEDLK